MRKTFAGIVLAIFFLGLLHAGATPVKEPTAVTLSKDKSFVSLVNKTLSYHAKENKDLLIELFSGKNNLVKSSAELRQKLSVALGYSSVKEFLKCEAELKELRQKVANKYDGFEFKGTNELAKAAIKEGVKNKRFNVSLVVYNIKSDQCDAALYGATAWCLGFEDNEAILECWDYAYDLWILCVMLAGQG